MIILEKQEFFVSYYEEEFGLAYGEIGGGDFGLSSSGEHYKVISYSENFNSLFGEVKDYLEKPEVFGNHYQFKYDSSAKKVLSKVERKSLEKLVKKHNKFYVELRKKRRKNG